MCDKRYQLIDFGLSSDYLDGHGHHLDHGPSNVFQGNIILASANALDYKQTSRKDDLVSLMYLLILLSQGHLNQFKISEKGTFKEMIERLAVIKKSQTLAQLCHSNRTRCFLAFAQEIQTIHYAEKPKYQILKQHLKQIVEEGNVEFEENQSKINHIRPGLASCYLIQK